MIKDLFGNSEEIEQLILDAPDSYYLTEKISENWYKDNRGFLILTEVVAARTGTQNYIGRELGVSDPDLINEIFYLERPEEEVFHPDALKSYEGAPFTDNHPVEKNVNVRNSRNLTKGHCRNARKASYKDKNGESLVLVDVVVTDESMIKKIENGQLHVSAGYSWDYEVIDLDKRRIKVKNIRINHLASVKRGRAGTAMIMDEDNTSINDDIIDLVDEDFIPEIVVNEGGETMPDKDKFKFSHKTEDGKKRILALDGFKTEAEAKEAAIAYIKSEKEEK